MTTYPNWFAHYAVRFFERHLRDLAGKPDLRFLQIGAFTGDASLWLLDNILTGDGSHLVDVDTWEGSQEPEHEAFDWSDVRRVYGDRIGGRRVAPFIGTSTVFFSKRWDPFDFIYIDGDHTASAVLEDAVHALEVLKPGGLLAFDDYLWKPSDGGGPTKAPGIAVDAIGAVYADQLEMVEAGLQVWFRKIA